MEENTKETFVIDASYILAFLLNENNHEVNTLMKQYKARQIYLISTILFVFEVCNTLRTAVIRKRISKVRAHILLQTFLQLDITEEKVDYLQVLKLALTKHISFYDASYLYLAKSKKIGLLSLDHSLK